MELSQLLDRIRAQCDQSRLPGPGERRVSLGAASNLLPGLPSHTGAAASAAAAASRAPRGAVSEVSRHSRIFMYLCLYASVTMSWPAAKQTHPRVKLQSCPITKADQRLSSAGVKSLTGCCLGKLQGQDLPYTPLQCLPFFRRFVQAFARFSPCMYFTLKYWTHFSQVP